MIDIVEVRQAVKDGEIEVFVNNDIRTMEQCVCFADVKTGEKVEIARLKNETQRFAW